MGYPLEPQPDGVACPLCWGSFTSPFGPNAPPDKLSVRFSGIQKSPLWLPVDGEPLNGVYLIDPDGACQWDSIALEGAFVEFLINFSRVVGTTSEFALCFRGLAFDSCASFFVNDLNPLVDFFFDGTCEILA